MLNFKHNDKAYNQHQSLDHKALSKFRSFTYLHRLAPFWWLSYEFASSRYQNM